MPPIMSSFLHVAVSLGSQVLEVFMCPKPLDSRSNLKSRFLTVKQRLDGNKKALLVSAAKATDEQSLFYSS